MLLRGRSGAGVGFAGALKEKIVELGCLPPLDAARLFYSLSPRKIKMEEIVSAEKLKEVREGVGGEGWGVRGEG